MANAAQSRTTVVAAFRSSQALRVSLVLALFAPCAFGLESSWEDVERIVAIGDLHGDYKQYQTVMRESRLIDRRGRWSGGRTHLVQTGDIVDRGPDSARIMRHLMKLETEARRQGGYLHLLIGNHEAMNILGDLRYVHGGEYAALKDSTSRARRDRLYSYHLEQLEKRSPEVRAGARTSDGPLSLDANYRQRWNEKYPLGYVEHRLAWGPDGEFGAFVLKHNAVVRINRTLFVHGGLSDRVLGLTLDEINERIRHELRSGQPGEAALATAEDGPLWYRGAAQREDDAERELLHRVLARFGATRLVMGHTPVPGYVLPRLEGKAILIDAGIASAYGSHRASLIVANETPSTVFLGHDIALPKHGDGFRDGLITYLRRLLAIEATPDELRVRLTEALVQATAGEAATSP